MKRTSKAANKRAQGRTGGAVADLLALEGLLEDAEAHASREVSGLIRRDQADTKLRDLLIEGASSPRGKEFRAADFGVLRRGVKERRRR